MNPSARFRVSHVVLDVDGTLIDFESAMRTALDATAALVSELIGSLLTSDALQRAREQVGGEPGMRGRTLREIRDESLRRVLAAGGVAYDGAVDEVSAVYYRTRDAEIRPFPEVEVVLDELVASGYTIVAATNGNAALARHPFFERFHHVHVAELAGVAKPDPRFFSGALEASGGRAAFALSVGDRVENDYAPALAIGMEAVLLDRLGRVSDPTLRRIRSLAELPGMVELA